MEKGNYTISSYMYIFVFFVVFFWPIIIKRFSPLPQTFILRYETYMYKVVQFYRDPTLTQVIVMKHAKLVLYHDS